MSEKPHIETPQEQIPRTEAIPERLARSHFESRESSRKNFFGLEEWDAFYREKGISLDLLTDAQREQIQHFPWSGDILLSSDPFHKGKEKKEIRETHFAFLGIDKINEKPLTLMKWLSLENEALYQKKDPWYQNQDFAKEALSFRWHLMPLQILPKSENKNWEEQLAILPKDYEVPKAVEEVSKNLLYYRKNIAHLINEKDKIKALKELNYDKWGRTNTLVSFGNRVNVGDFRPGGLRVGGDWGGLRASDIGLTLSRKLKK